MGPSIYLGVQGYGCIRAEDKDRFAHRFRQDDSVCCYAVCNKGRYAIQNRLQEGQAYHLTIRQETALCLKSAHEPTALSFCLAFSPAGLSAVMHRYSAVLRISGLLRRCIIRRFTVFPVSAPCKTCSEPP